MKYENIIVPITEEVSVDSILISCFASLTFPNTLEFMVLIDQLLDQAIDETFDKHLTYDENAKITEIRYFQLLWKAILEKGRDEEYYV
jgi:hypothetical protein